MLFRSVLKDAIATYGIPNKLYVDSGAPYKNHQLDMICASVGTVLLHTPVRDGASKGYVKIVIKRGKWSGILEH